MSTANNPEYLYYDVESLDIAVQAQDVFTSGVWHQLMESALHDPHIKNVLEQVDEVKRKTPSAIIYPKWTCGGCGERSTGDTPGQFHYLWRHDDKLDGSICGYQTPIAEGDLGYAMVLQQGKDATLVAEAEGEGSVVQVHGEGPVADKWRQKLMDAMPPYIPDGNRRFGPTTDS